MKININELEVLKYCNEEIRTLSPLFYEHRDKVFSYLAEIGISRETYNNCGKILSRYYL